jgi:hypothetical protein
LIFRVGIFHFFSGWVGGFVVVGEVVGGLGFGLWLFNVGYYGAYVAAQMYANFLVFGELWAQKTAAE